MRDLPYVFLVVEHLLIAHMKNTVSLGLRAKKNLGVAGVPAQVGGTSGAAD